MQTNKLLILGLVAIVLTFAFGIELKAQPFDLLSPSGNLSTLVIGNCDAAWADYNNDGYKELLITGSTTAVAVTAAGGSTTKIYQFNPATSTFGDSTTIAFPSGISGYRSGKIVWADFNGDGYLDFFIMGNTSTSGTSAATSDVFINTATDALHPNRRKFVKKVTPVVMTNNVTTTAVALKGAYTGSAITMDYNNDGKMDLVYDGSGGTISVKVYRGLGDGTFDDETSFAGFTANTNAYLRHVITPIDYNNDGYMDFIWGQYANNAQTLYKNNGDGTFTALAGLIGGTSVRYGGGMHVGDVDNDGYTDYLAGGNSASTATFYQVFRNNNGDGTFPQLQDFKLANTGTYSGEQSVQMADYNNDGYIDIVECGTDLTSAINRILTKVRKSNAGASFDTLVFEELPITSKGSIAIVSPCWT